MNATCIHGTQTTFLDVKRPRGLSLVPLIVLQCGGKAILSSGKTNAQVWSKTNKQMKQRRSNYPSEDDTVIESVCDD